MSAVIRQGVARWIRSGALSRGEPVRLAVKAWDRSSGTYEASGGVQLSDITSEEFVDWTLHSAELATAVEEASDGAPKVRVLVYDQANTALSRKTFTDQAALDQEPAAPATGKGEGPAQELLGMLAKSYSIQSQSIVALMGESRETIHDLRMHVEELVGLVTNQAFHNAQITSALGQADADLHRSVAGHKSVEDRIMDMVEGVLTPELLMSILAKKGESKGKEKPKKLNDDQAALRQGALNYLASIPPGERAAALGTDPDVIRLMKEPPASSES